MNDKDDLSDLQLPRDRQYTEAEMAQYVWKPAGVRFLRGEKFEAYTGSEPETVSVWFLFVSY